MRPYFNYLRPETGETEKVTRERWRWEAHYSDGTVLQQFDDETGSFHQLREIDQSRLNVFRMVSDNRPGIDLSFDPATMKLIHFYQKGREFVFTDETKGEGSYIYFHRYVFGYESAISGQKFLTYILDDDQIVISPTGPVAITLNG